MRNSPSASTVYTGQSGGRGDNSGGAAVLAPQADTFQFVQNLMAQKQARDIAQIRIDRDNQKRLDDIFKNPDIGKVPLRFQDELMNDLNDFGKTAVDLRTGKYKGKEGKTLNPLNPYDPEVRHILTEKEFNLQNKAETARRIEGVIADAIKQSKDPKWDAKYLADRMEELGKVKNIEEAQKWADVSPLRPAVNTFAIAEDLGTQMTEVAQEIGDKTTFRAFMEPENVKSLAKAWLTNPAGRQQFMAGLEAGVFKDEEDFAEQMNAILQGQNPEKTKVTYDEPRASSGSGSGSGGSKLLISKSNDQTSGLLQGSGYNRVSVKRSGTNDDLPPVSVFSDEKDPNNPNKYKTIDFQPVEFIMGDNGRIGVRGVEVIPQAFGGSIKKEKWVDYDRNKDMFESQLEGQSMYEIMGVEQQTTDSGYDETKEIGGKKYGRKGNEWYEL